MSFSLRQVKNELHQIANGTSPAVMKTILSADRSRHNNVGSFFHNLQLLYGARLQKATQNVPEAPEAIKEIHAICKKERLTNDITEKWLLDQGISIDNAASYREQLLILAKTHRMTKHFLMMIATITDGHCINLVQREQRQQEAIQYKRQPHPPMHVATMPPLKRPKK